MCRSKKRLLIRQSAPVGARRRPSISSRIVSQSADRWSSTIALSGLRPSPSRASVGSQLDQRLLHHGPGKPVRRVQVDLALPDADEQVPVLLLRRLGIHDPAGVEQAGSRRSGRLPAAASGNGSASRDRPQQRGARARRRTAPRARRRNRPARGPRARACERMSASKIPCGGASKIADVDRFLGLDQVDDAAVGAHLAAGRARPGAANIE